MGLPAKPRGNGSVHGGIEKKVGFEPECNQPYPERKIEQSEHFACFRTEGFAETDVVKPKVFQ